MPDPNDIPRRRRVLVLDVTQAAAEVSRLVHEAHDLNLPVEPGVRDGRNALVRWAVLLEEVLPQPSLFGTYADISNSAPGRSTSTRPPAALTNERCGVRCS